MGKYCERKKVKKTKKKEKISEKRRTESDKEICLRRKTKMKWNKLARVH